MWGSMEGSISDLTRKYFSGVEDPNRKLTSAGQEVFVYPKTFLFAPGGFQSHSNAEFSLDFTYAGTVPFEVTRNCAMSNEPPGPR